MKYLNENKTDVSKWLEFINYQTHLASKLSGGMMNALYEKKKSIFEKAIQENPTSFRLKIELVKLKANSIEYDNLYNAFETVEREFYMLLSTESIKLNVKKVLLFIYSFNQFNDFTGKYYCIKIKD
jgi:lipopolysaccharide biosynthesis regulator YciM